MKKVLMLGGAYSQIPMIEEAKKQGLYVVTCDYLPDNPGHKLADEYYNISTTDKVEVLNLANKIKPDFIMAYASDPAAPVAAYVSEKLNLPTNTFKSIRTLSEKDYFREFLHQNGFNAPKSIGVEESDLSSDILNDFRLPIIIKPTDSSGSKGVVKVNYKDDFESATKYALAFSRNKRIILEEFIDTNGEQLHGDGYVVDGKLVFCYLGDHHYNIRVNPFVPYSTTWPSKVDPYYLNRVEDDVQKIISMINFDNGPVNIEARIFKEKVYIMEIGPRSGGNFVPQVLKWITNFDMVHAALAQFLNQPIIVTEIEKGIGANYVIHSDKDGNLKSVLIDDILKKYIKELHIYIKEGDPVKSYQGSNAAIGILLLKFDSIITRDSIMKDIHNLVVVNVV